MSARDPVLRRATQRAWAEKNIKAGYGKWLYAKRKLVYDDAKEFRSALEQILSAKSLDAAHLVATKALADSNKRQEKIRPWRETISLKTLAEKNHDPPIEDSS